MSLFISLDSQSGATVRLMLFGVLMAFSLFYFTRPHSLHWSTYFFPLPTLAAAARFSSRAVALRALTEREKHWYTMTMNGALLSDEQMEMGRRTGYLAQKLVGLMKVDTEEDCRRRGQRWGQRAENSKGRVGGLHSAGALHGFSLRLVLMYWYDEKQKKSSTPLLSTDDCSARYLLT